MDGWGPAMLENLEDRYATLSAFGREQLGRVTGDVLYLFGGVDLPTAMGLFPDAAAYHMVSSIPIGGMSCLAHSNTFCRSLAANATLHFFAHWESFGFSRQSTIFMMCEY